MPTEPVPGPEPESSMVGKLGAALPIALTALATAFAGMSTGELQQAMFWRSYAAQDQSKATNQWTYAGFKRDRSLICQSTADQLRAAAGTTTNPFAGGSKDDPAVAWLAGNGPPAVDPYEVRDDGLKQLLTEIARRAPEVELLARAGKIRHAEIDAAVNEAESAADQLDREWSPVLERAWKLAEARPEPVARKAAAYDMDGRRYRIESRLNQQIGFLYEARVKVSTAESDRHRTKSKQFFYAMLVAQVGATISSLALARHRRSVLWAVAGVTGLVALLIGAYVYLADFQM